MEGNPDFPPGFERLIRPALCAVQIIGLRHRLLNDATEEVAFGGGLTDCFSCAPIVRFTGTPNTKFGHTRGVGLIASRRLAKFLVKDLANSIADRCCTT
jgi:hypothetical protein